MKERNSGENNFNKSIPKPKRQVKRSNYTQTALTFFLLFMHATYQFSPLSRALFIINPLISINTSILGCSHVFLLSSSISMCEAISSPLNHLFSSLLIEFWATFSNAGKLHSPHPHSRYLLHPLRLAYEAPDVTSKLTKWKASVSSPTSITWLPKASDAWHDRLLVSHAGPLPTRAKPDCTQPGDTDSAQIKCENISHLYQGVNWTF